MATMEPNYTPTDEQMTSICERIGQFILSKKTPIKVMGRQFNAAPSTVKSWRADKGMSSKYLIAMYQRWGVAFMEYITEPLTEITEQQVLISLERVMSEVAVLEERIKADQRSAMSKNSNEVHKRDSFSQDESGVLEQFSKTAGKAVAGIALCFVLMSPIFNTLTSAGDPQRNVRNARVYRTTTRTHTQRNFA